MGRFFANLQIRKNVNQTQSAFLKTLISAMKKLGYEKATADDAELSYFVAFSSSNRWVTLCAEDYVSNAEKVNTDAQKLAANLKTFCISNTVIDSDVAVLDMYAGQEERADKVIIGYGDAYGLESREETKGKRDLWEPLMAEENLWDKFSEIQSSNYTFAEDGLIKLSELLGISPDLIIADYDDLSSVSEDNKAVVPLYFKKAGTKAMSLNAAFVKVFGEALEPLGFKKIKNRHPYYVRVINGEILHIVTYIKERGEKDKFNIYAGIATVYRHEIDFSNLDACCCFIPLKTPRQYHYYDFEFNPDTPSMPEPAFRYKIQSIIDNESINNAFSEALKDTMLYIIPVLSKVTTLRKCITFFKTHTVRMQIYSPNDNYGIKSDSGRSSEGLLYFAVDDHSDMMYEMNRNLEFFKKTSENHRTNIQRDYETHYKISNEARMKWVEKRDEIYNDKKLYEQVMKEIEERKIRNTEMLKKYGIEIM